MRSAVAAVILLAALSSTAAAAPHASITVSPAAVRAGHTLTLAGSAGGCTVGNTVTLISHAFAPAHRFASVPAVFTKVKANGKFFATTRIPATRRPGRYGITARCGGGNLGVLAHVRVTA
jgi:hypothetical protein